MSSSWSTTTTKGHKHGWNKNHDNRKAFNTQLNVNTKNSGINTAVVKGLQLFINLEKLPWNLDNINCFHFNINYAEKLERIENYFKKLCVNTCRNLLVSIKLLFPDISTEQFCYKFIWHLILLAAHFHVNYTENKHLFHNSVWFHFLGFSSQINSRFFTFMLELEINSRVFIRKILGTRYGLVGTRFLWL